MNTFFETGYDGFSSAELSGRPGATRALAGFHAAWTSKTKALSQRGTSLNALGATPYITDGIDSDQAKPIQRNAA